MPTLSLKERVAALETEVADLKKRLGRSMGNEKPWWEEIAGTFENDPLFEKAMKLGRAYRESLRPKRRARRNGRSREPVKRGRITCL